MKKRGDSRPDFSGEFSGDFPGDFPGEFQAEFPGEFRIGIGFDVHKFEQGRRLTLGGVEIPYDKGLAGHSDADVLCHAITDAILGAMAAGDIGTFFPDDDPKYKDADSLQLLAEVADFAAKHGWTTCNVDSVLNLEKPRIRPFIAQMRDCIAAALKIDAAKVSVKGTTSEGLGFTGRGEGVAAQAIIMIKSK